MVRDARIIPMGQIIIFIIGIVIGSFGYRFIVQRWKYGWAWFIHEGICELIGHKKPDEMPEYFSTYICHRCYHCINNIK